MRVVTPGTLSDEALLDDRVEKLLLAVSHHQDDYGIAYLDLSTGRFRVLEVAGDGLADSSLTALASSLAGAHQPLSGRIGGLARREPRQRLPEPTTLGLQEPVKT